MYGGQLMRRLTNGRRWPAALLGAALLAAVPGIASAQGAGLGAAGELVDPQTLRVCSDPSDMPFSDESRKGFENKIADLVAAKLERKAVRYTWYPMATGFVRNTLRANRCDIIIGFAQGDELVQNTNAYYRSAYVLLYRKGGGLDGVDAISDPRLRDKRLGVVGGTPPSSYMAQAGLMKKAKAYPLMVDTRLMATQGEVMVKDLLAGEIDAALAWGPMIGYYVREAKSDIVMVPLLKDKGAARMTYRITMGVRPSDQEWKRTLNRFIRDNQEEINKILLEYNVPLLDENDRPITQ